MDRAGERAMLLAIKELYGRDLGVNLPVDLRGRTDTSIARDLLAFLNVPHSLEEESRFRRAYLRAHAAHASHRQGAHPRRHPREAPSTPSASIPSIHQALLTGNLEGRREAPSSSTSASGSTSSSAPSPTTATSATSSARSRCAARRKSSASTSRPSASSSSATRRTTSPAARLSAPRPSPSPPAPSPSSNSPRSIPRMSSRTCPTPKALVRRKFDFMTDPRHQQLIAVSWALVWAASRRAKMESCVGSKGCRDTALLTVTP